MYDFKVKKGEQFYGTTYKGTWPSPEEQGKPPWENDHPVRRLRMSSYDFIQLGEGILHLQSPCVGEGSILKEA